MSLFPDITPLLNEAKEFNKNQREVIALLKEIKQILQSKPN